MSDTSSPAIGFIGLGTMGEPMALNLARAGVPLMVWNRSPGKYAALAEAGAIVADSPDQLFEQCRLIILMLADGASIDTVLGRGSEHFPRYMQDRTLVNMSTVPPGYSQALGMAIVHAGGCYVEAPVSGSRKPAEAGQA